ncbi:MAG: hypothetical protein JWN17_1140 [Frankiales bacterium]|nr:hypothetical protein [Frankiales bacterium]
MLSAAGPVLANTLKKGGSAGYLALLLVVVMFLVTVLLIRNMSGRLKRLPKEFPETPASKEPQDPEV